MGALPKFVPSPTQTGVGRVTVIDGRQAVPLPENVHVDVAELDVLQHGTDLFMRPASKQLSPEDIAPWLAEMYQPGDFMPNQPPV